MKLKTKDLVLAALLTCMSIIIPNVFPSLPLGPFTATAFSHLPVMISMFISPVVAIATAVGSLLGFAVKFSAMPWVIARAAMHIPFAIVGAVMLKKYFNPYFVSIVTLIVHSALEVLVLFPFLNMMPSVAVDWKFVTFAGTAIHHLIDFIAAAIILVPLSKANFVAYNVQQNFSFMRSQEGK